MKPLSDDDLDRLLKRSAALVFILALALLAFLVWATTVLVLWVTSK